MTPQERQLVDELFDKLARLETTPRDRDAARRVMAAFGYPAGLLRGAEANGFGTPAVLPTTWLVDRRGVVRAELHPDTNPITPETLPRLVGPLLAER